MILQPDDSRDCPTAAEILTQIGWVLTLHLAIAGGIVHAVQALGFG